MRISLWSVLLFFTLFVSIGSTQETTTQEYTTWGLPDGAKTRLGKGEIAATQFSPEGSRHTPCAVCHGLLDVTAQRQS